MYRCGLVTYEVGCTPIYTRCKVLAGFMSQDAATSTVFSNVNNPLFRSNFPTNYSILINIF